mmetsp:Transcript_50656/g.80703  ORF Transcript_50656/g.80703 Transcript_50656/m.80703 type:complete len:231 (-) Transcript_50656:351-1043(-)
MLVTLIFLPVFFVFGVAFGLVSWIFAAWTVTCSDKFDWGRTWQAFSRSSIKMSQDHNTLVVHAADFVETFECIKPCRMMGKNMLSQYYKIGHSLSVYGILWLITLLKAILLVPIWAAICCRQTLNEQMTEMLSKGKQKKKRQATSSTALTDDEDKDKIYVTSSSGTHEEQKQQAFTGTSGVYGGGWADDVDAETFGDQQKFHNLYAANTQADKVETTDTAPDNPYASAYD